MQPLQCCKIDDKMSCSSALPSLNSLSAYVFQVSLINRPSNRQFFCMDNMSVLRQALDILPFRVSVDEIAVKQAVIDHLAKEVCIAVRVKVPISHRIKEIHSLELGVHKNGPEMLFGHQSLSQGNTLSLWHPGKESLLAHHVDAHLCASQVQREEDPNLKE